MRGADIGKCVKITDMFSAMAATSTVTAASAIMQQVEREEVTGHDNCQIEEQACKREAKDKE